MSIGNQISINADEPEAPECPVCNSAMTLGHYAGIDWLECDNEECDHIIEGE